MAEVFPKYPLQNNNNNNALYLGWQSNLNWLADNDTAGGSSQQPTTSIIIIVEYLDELRDFIWVTIVPI